MNSDPNRLPHGMTSIDYERGAFIIGLLDDSGEVAHAGLRDAAAEIWQSIQDFVGVPDNDWRPFHVQENDRNSSRVTELGAFAYPNSRNRACPQCSRDRGREHGTPCGALACPYRGRF